MLGSDLVEPLFLLEGLLFLDLLNSIVSLVNFMGLIIFGLFDFLNFRFVDLLSLLLGVLESLLLNEVVNSNFRLLLLLLKPVL